MAATGKTPILLYGSTTATNTPSAGNLTNSSDGCEIAINVADKNLFFKDSTNTVNTVPIRQSSGSSNGWLSATDWTTFNSKVSSQWVTSGSSVYYSAGTVGVYSTNFSGAALTIGQNSSNWTLGTNYAAYIVGNGYAGGMALNATSFQIGQNSAARNLTLHSGTGWAEQVRIGPTGNVTLQNGNLVIGTSGKGIDFSATAGTGTSELLDDYEEGTWTPTVSASTTPPTVTYSIRSGTYTKVGRLVTCTGIIVLASTSGGSGNVRITGLPFTNGNQENVGYIGFANNYTTAKPSQLIVFGAESQVTPYYDSSATASAQLPVTFLTASSAIYFTVQYEVS